MARIAYDPETGLGQLLAEGVDDIMTGRHKLRRFLAALSQMTAAEAESEIGIPQASYTTVVTGLTTIDTALHATAINKLDLVDQG